MKDKTNWWDSRKPIWKDDGDGQRFQEIYARQIKKRWEYALVSRFDDGEFISAVLITDGKLIKP